MWNVKKNQQGFSLIEVLLATVLAGMFLAASAGASIYGVRMFKEAGRKSQAVFLAEEGLAAAQNIRDDDYANLTDGTWGLTTAGSEWNFSGSSDTTDIFTRTVTVAAVDSTKKTVTSNVTWTEVTGSSRTISLVDYLSDWLSSSLSPWVSAALAGSVNLSSTQSLLKVNSIGNYAYAVRSTASGISFFIFDISTPTAPAQVGSLSLNGTPSNVVVSGSYAYVSSSSDTQEVQIINISTPTAPTLAASYNASGSMNATGVAVSGNYLYVTRASGSSDEFLVLNIATPTAPVLTGSMGLAGSANEVAISGNYAYVASAINTQELQVINITTPSAPALLGGYDRPSSSSDALTVAVSGSVVYLGINNTMYILSDAVHGTPTLSGSIGPGGTVNDISLDSSGLYAFVASSYSSNEFRLVDANTPASPVFVASVNLASNAIGVSYNSSLDVAVVATAAAAAEFVVINHP